MERRNALRNMGASLGFVVAAPTLMSIIQGCASDGTKTWTPQLISEEAGHTLIQIVDAILPKTDTLSASEVNVHVFMDSYAKAVMNAKQQEQFASTIEKLGEEALSKSGKTKITQLSPEDLDGPLRSALKGELELPFAKRIRDLTIWGYKCTEYVGEEVLAYLPVPGQYIPCGDKEKLTQGRAWSL